MTVVMTCADITAYFSTAGHGDAEHSVFLTLRRRCRRSCSADSCVAPAECVFPAAKGTEGPHLFTDEPHKLHYLATWVRRARNAELRPGPPDIRVIPTAPEDQRSLVAPGLDPSERSEIASVLDQFRSLRQQPQGAALDKQVLGRSKEIDRSRDIAAGLVEGLLAMIDHGAPEPCCADLIPTGTNAAERQRRKRALDGARQLLVADGEALGMPEVAHAVVSHFCPPGH